MVQRDADKIVWDKLIAIVHFYNLCVIVRHAKIRHMEIGNICRVAIKSTSDILREI